MKGENDMLNEAKELGKWISVIILIGFYLYSWAWVIIDITKRRKERERRCENTQITLFSGFWLIGHCALLVLFFTWCWSE